MITAPRVAAAPISWGICEIPGWGARLPAERVLDEIAAAGYAGTELGPPGFLPQEPQTLRRELSSRGLSLVGAFCPVTLHEAGSFDGGLREALKTARLLAECAATVLVLATTGDERRRALAGRVPRDGSASFDDAQWARFCDGVNEVARRTSELGLVTAFHPHAASWIETPQETERLLAGTDPALVGLCLDTGHIAYGGGDPLDLAERQAPRVRHVHLKDLRRVVHTRAAARGDDFTRAVADGVFAPLGEGDLAIRDVLAALRRGGFSGWLVVEQDVRLGVTPGAAPLADARRNREFVRAAFRE